MKKIFTILLVLATAGVSAQLSCTSAIPLTNGYTNMGISTPGTGGAPGSWVTSATLCGTAGTFHHNCYTSVGDDYVFSYTTGAVAGESVSFTIKTNINYIGLVAFTNCTGTSFSGCLDWRYAPTLNTTMTDAAANLAANQTVYFGVGIWSTPNNLMFDVMDFTVTAPASVAENTLEGLKVYPNPVKDILKLEAQAVIDRVEIYNLAGQKVKSITGTGRLEENIDVSGLASGIYSVKIHSAGAEAVQKIMKE